MLKLSSKTLKITLALLLCLLCMPLFAENFVIEKYDIKADVGLDRVYTITEKLTLDYSVSSHGFYRSIPIRYAGGQKARVKIFFSSDNYETSIDGDYLVVKIGSGDRYVSGLKEYTLSYTYDLGDDGYPDYDEFYYNLIGDSWNTTIDDVNFEINFPAPLDEAKIWLTYGEYGSTSTATPSLSQDKKTITGHFAHLEPNEAITLRTQMDPGYFVGAYVKKDLTVPFFLIYLVLALLYIVIFLYLFNKYGRDKPLTPVVQFTAPYGLTPLECGYLIDQTADDKDITSMFFYWADKGYLTIEEGKKRGDFTFHKIKNLPSSALKSERMLFNAVFDSSSDVTIAALSNGTFAQKVQKDIKSAVENEFVGDKDLSSKLSVTMDNIVMVMGAIFTVAFDFAFSINDKECFSMNLVASGVFFIVSLLFASWLRKYKFTKHFKKVLLFVGYFFVGLISFLTLISLTTFTSSVITLIATVLSFVIIVLSSFGSNWIQQRSEYGTKVIEGILGFREYIDKVEVDKLKLLIDQDPEYFYHILSYAIVFDLESKWAKKFEGLKLSKASWYKSSYYSPMDYLFYSSMFHRWDSSYHSSITPKLSNNSTSGHGGHSTFSGSSGFSGGGFGGGGGGSW